MQLTGIVPGSQHQRLCILLRWAQQVAIPDAEATLHADRDVQQILLSIPPVEIFPELDRFSQRAFSPVYALFRRGVELPFEIGGHGVVAVDGDSGCLPGRRVPEIIDAVGRADCEMKVWVSFAQ